MINPGKFQINLETWEQTDQPEFIPQVVPYPDRYQRKVLYFRTLSPDDLSGCSPERWLPDLLSMQPMFSVMVPAHPAANVRNPPDWCDATACHFPLGKFWVSSRWYQKVLTIYQEYLTRYWSSFEQVWWERFISFWMERVYMYLPPSR